RSASTVPLLRRKLQQILAAEDVVEHSHDERAIRTLFEAMPKQDLCEAATEDLRRTISHLLETTRSGDVRVVFRTGPVSRYLSAVVAVPRDRFSSRLRVRIQALLARESGAAAVDYHPTMSARDEPLMHFGLHLAEDVGDPDLDVDALQREIQRLIRTFEDALAEALAGRMGFEEAQRVARHWCRILPATYTETTHVATAVTDIEELQQLEEPDALRVRLVKVPRQPRDRLRVRFYKAGEGMVLSD